jgi:16S rRNA U516 pseudouridylate synthase RsuA-like enzyme
MDEDRFNMALRKFLKQVGVTSQRVIEEAVRSGKVEGNVLKVKMTLTAENAPIQHVIDADIELR